MAAAFTGCALVDENLTDCEANHRLNYEIRLVTNMTTELQTQLSMAADVQVSTALQAYLGNVFTDYAHDVNLSFYDVFGDSLRLHHEAHQMEASQSKYTLFIPVREYMHVAVANMDLVPGLELVGDEKCHAARLQQEVRDTVESFKTGVFTARLPMHIKEGMDQEFDVKLYTASSVHAVVLDTLGSHIKDIKVFSTGFATSFNLADSVFHYSFTPVVRDEEVEVGDTPGNPLCFASVTFPSRNPSSTKVIINNDDEFVTESADESLWRCKVYATLPDGSITETVLGVKLPLLPGEFKIIKCTVTNDGSTSPKAPWVGASVTLNWNDQPAWNVDI